MALFKLTKRDRNNKLREVGSIEIRNQTDESADLCFFGDINSESLGEWQKYYPEDKAPSDVKDFLNQLEMYRKLTYISIAAADQYLAGLPFTICLSVSTPK